MDFGAELPTTGEASRARAASKSTPPNAPNCIHSRHLSSLRGDSRGAGRSLASPEREPLAGQRWPLLGQRAKGMRHRRCAQARLVLLMALV